MRHQGTNGKNDGKWRDERTVEKMGDDVSMGKRLVLRAIFISGESINI